MKYNIAAGFNPTVEIKCTVGQNKFGFLQGILKLILSKFEQTTTRNVILKMFIYMSKTTTA
jgi:hypothetical protein